MVDEPLIKDELIISQLKNKDQRAIKAILDKYGSTLYGTIYRKVQSEVVATEKMKNTFLKVWQNAETFNEQEERLFNWLLKMTK